MRDYQANRVYSWENYLFRRYDSSWQSLEAMQKLATYVFIYLQIPVGTVISNKKITVIKGQCDWQKRIIEFNPRWIRRGILLHEICHLMPRCKTNHGSTFVKYLCILFNRYMKIPKKVLRQSLIKYKIDCEEF